MMFRVLSISSQIAQRRLEISRRKNNARIMSSCWRYSWLDLVGCSFSMEVLLVAKESSGTVLDFPTPVPSTPACRSLKLHAAKVVTSLGTKDNVEFTVASLMSDRHGIWLASSWLSLSSASNGGLTWLSNDGEPSTLVTAVRPLSLSKKGGQVTALNRETIFLVGESDACGLLHGTRGMPLVLVASNWLPTSSLTRKELSELLRRRPWRW